MKIRHIEVMTPGFTARLFYLGRHAADIRNPQNDDVSLVEWTSGTEVETRQALFQEALQHVPHDQPPMALALHVTELCRVLVDMDNQGHGDLYLETSIGVVTPELEDLSTEDLRALCREFSGKELPDRELPAHVGRLLLERFDLMARERLKEAAQADRPRTPFGRSRKRIDLYPESEASLPRAGTKVYKAFQALQVGTTFEGLKDACGTRPYDTDKNGQLWGEMKSHRWTRDILTKLARDYGHRIKEDDTGIIRIIEHSEDEP